MMRESLNESRPPAWNDHWERAWAEAVDDLTGTDIDRGATSEGAGAPDLLVPVRVVRTDKGGITVADGAGNERLVIAAKAVRRVVVGDVCGLDASVGRIELILPRRTVFERRAPGAERDDLAVESKALAANMDVVLVLQAIDGGVNTSRLAREMVLAWESGAQPVVVLTKADLVDPTAKAEQCVVAEEFAPGVPVVAVSSVTHWPADVQDGQAEVQDEQVAPVDPAAETRDGRSGITLLGEHLPAGSVTALLGASGAGKSTLANSLAGHRVQLTAEVRGDQRGRHTTTAGQMLPLAGNRWLIDTPGIRGVGLWHADAGLEQAFADLEPHAASCRFSDCSHTNEPGCGILEAVDEGLVGRARLDAWHELVAEVQRLEDSAEERARELEREGNQRSRRRAAAQRGRPRR